METHSKKRDINILLISGQPSDISEVKKYLANSTEHTYHVEHRPDFFGSSDLLNKENSSIEIILLDLGIFGSDHTRDVFRRMVDMAHGIPIIVFTDRQDHDMALWAIEEGAADNITRGHLDTDVYKFRDAIAFSMARSGVSKKLENKNIQASTEASAELQKLRKEGMADMDRQQERYAALVRSILEKGNEDVALAVTEISEALEQAKLKNTILLTEIAGNLPSNPSGVPY